MTIGKINTRVIVNREEVLFNLDNLDSQRYHLISELDFTETDIFSRRDKETPLKDRDILKVTTTIDYTGTNLETTTRFYKKEAEEGDFGTDKMLDPAFQTKRHLPSEALFPTHFRYVQEAIDRHK